MIGFLCIRQAKSGGENQVVSSMTLYNEIQRQRPDLMEVLMKPFLYKRHTVDVGNDQPYTQQPIFSFCQGYFGANLLRVLIERAYASDDTPEMNDLQREALDFVDDQAARPDSSCDIHPAVWRYLVSEQLGNIAPPDCVRRP